MNNGSVWWTHFLFLQPWWSIQQLRNRNFCSIIHGKASWQTFTLKRCVRFRLQRTHDRGDTIVVTLPTNGHIIIESWHVVQWAIAILQINLCFALSLTILKCKVWFTSSWLSCIKWMWPYPSWICSVTKDMDFYQIVFKAKTKFELERKEPTDRIADYFHSRIHIAGFSAECFEWSRTLHSALAQSPLVFRIHSKLPCQNSIFLGVHLDCEVIFWIHSCRSMSKSILFPSHRA